MTVTIKRAYRTSKQTLGIGNVFDHNGTCIFSFSTLELPYNKNEVNNSSIPVGIYEVSKRYSFKYGQHYIINNVLNRSMILIHNGNYNKQTKGCILVGIYAKDINNDRDIDVVMSGLCIEIMNNILPNRFKLTIS
jgi:Family of unknown function (DUF5675)